MQTTLDVVVEEYKEILLIKFKKSLSKWIQSFNEENLIVRTVDCMFASLEKEDQDAVARKWYKSIVDHKDVGFYKQMAENRKLEIESWKKKNKEQRKIYRENIKEWMANIFETFDYWYHEIKESKSPFKAAWEGIKTMAAASFVWLKEKTVEFLDMMFNILWDDIDRHAIK